MHISLLCLPDRIPAVLICSDCGLQRAKQTRLTEEFITFLTLLLRSETELHMQALVWKTVLAFEVMYGGYQAGSKYSVLLLEG